LQHRELFRIANKYYNVLFSDAFTPDNKMLLRILKELKHYSDFHCRYEKDFYSDDIVKEYFDVENMLAERINVLVSNYKENDIVALYGFAEFLRKWLLNHILILNKSDFRNILRKELINLSCN